MSDIYRASKENIKRAHRKLDDLMATLRAFFDTKPYTVRIHHDGRLTHVIARRDKDVPEDVAFDVVEIVLRLRAALDKAVVNAVHDAGKGTSGVGFPFGGLDANTGQPLPFPDARTGDRLKKKLTPALWDFLMAQHPHPGGNNALWAINELANADKHRKDLVELRPNLAHNFMLFGDGFGNSYVDFLAFMPSEFQHILADQEREKVLLSAGQAVTQQNIQQSFSVNVVFGGGLPVAGVDVIGLLNTQIRLTEQIIEGWAALPTK